MLTACLRPTPGSASRRSTVVALAARHGIARHPSRPSPVTCGRTATTSRSSPPGPSPRRGRVALRHHRRVPDRARGRPPRLARRLATALPAEHPPPRRDRDRRPRASPCPRSPPAPRPRSSTTVAVVVHDQPVVRAPVAARPPVHDPVPRTSPPHRRSAAGDRARRGSRRRPRRRQSLAHRARVLEQARAARVDDSEVARYWRAVIAANRATLRSGDPSLVFPGEIVRFRLLRGACPSLRPVPDLLRKTRRPPARRPAALHGRTGRATRRVRRPRRRHDDHVRASGTSGRTRSRAGSSSTASRKRRPRLDLHAERRCLRWIVAYAAIHKAGAVVVPDEHAPLDRRGAHDPRPRRAAAVDHVRRAARHTRARSQPRCRRSAVVVSADGRPATCVELRRSPRRDGEIQVPRRRSTTSPTSCTRRARPACRRACWSGTATSR